VFGWRIRRRRARGIVLALYSSAKDHCPRMIALDETFIGIDERYKPDPFGLAVKFDLDVFMTGRSGARRVRGECRRRPGPGLVPGVVGKARHASTRSLSESGCGSAGL
jgi:hypothetical protein